MTENRKKVFVGLSGGVDSSVSAYLLNKENYDVVGVHLRCWNKDGCDEREAEDARRVAEKIGIPFYVFDLEKEYKNKVVNYMIEGYKKGITPNPDIMCNKEIKFGLFLEKALGLGADYIATGHYVRLRRNDEFRVSNSEDESKLEFKNSKFSLWQAKDLNKDQSYFLWTLTQAQLKHVLFPLGELTKSEVRKIAKDAGLHVADKKDSQGICFVGKVTLKEFLGEYLPKIEGKAVNSDGEVVGTHVGAHFYTIGQRHGFGIGGGEPYYVADKDVLTNTVTLVTREDAEPYTKEIAITEVNLIGIDKLPNELLARVRYRQELKNAKFEENKIIFDEPQRFVAKGQSAVLYTNEGQMLGGGIII